MIPPLPLLSPHHLSTEIPPSPWGRALLTPFLGAACADCNSFKMKASQTIWKQWCITQWGTYTESRNSHLPSPSGAWALALCSWTNVTDLTAGSSNLHEGKLNTCEGQKPCVLPHSQRIWSLNFLGRQLCWGLRKRKGGRGWKLQDAVIINIRNRPGSHTFRKRYHKEHPALG